MANEFFNKLILFGDRQAIQNLLTKANTKNAYGEESAFTFNAFVPMPPDVYRGSAGEEERKKYPGDKNRYDWSIKHWGVKGDAYQVSINVNTIRFSTAWDAPLPILKAISKQHKDITIKYYGEDLSVDYSLECIFKNGKLCYKCSFIQKLMRGLW